MDFTKKRELDRIGNVLIFLADNTYQFGVTKANKLLYYLDCLHLVRYGRKVIKANYLKLVEGPVPIDIYNRLNSILELNNSNEDIDTDNLNYFEYLAKYVDVIIEKLSDTITLHKICAKKEFNPKLFSGSEIIILKEIVKEYQYTSAKELSRRTHKELPWLLADSNEIIDLKLYAKDKMNEEQYQEIEYIERTQNEMDHNYKCEIVGL